MNEQKHKNEAISLATGAGDYYFAKAESSTESSTKAGHYLIAETFYK